LRGLRITWTLGHKASHGLEDTLKGKIKAWSDAAGRQSKRIEDLGDIARLVETHRHLWELLTDDLKQQIERPMA
jgi:hypothetical protein